MLGPLNEHSDEPLHTQLTRRLRDAILAGRLPGGTPLPSIRELARDAKVSIITAQRTLTDLELEGLVDVRRGKGFHVKPLTDTQRTQLALEGLKHALSPILTRALDQGLTPTHVEHLLRDLLNDHARTP